MDQVPPESILSRRRRRNPRRIGHCRTCARTTGGSNSALHDRFVASYSRFACSEATSISPHLARSRDCRINRYYDPATGQFLSVDPLVGSTGTPYAYSSDNPTNVVDPLGQYGWYFVNGKWHHYKYHKYGIGLTRAELTSPKFHSWLKQEYHLTDAAIKSFSLIFSSTTFSLRTIGLSASHATRSEIQTTLREGNLADHAATALNVLGGALEGFQVWQQTHSMVKAVGAGVGSVVGGYAGAAAGMAACSGPEDGVGIVCGWVGGMVGSAVGGWLGSLL